jgi:hypothetical protein
MMNEQYSITNCATFTHETAAGGACSRALPCLGDPNIGSDDWTMAQLQNALGHPDVVDALQEQATFGAAAPGLGTHVVIRIGDEEITIHSACQDAGSSCVDPPEGVYLLREMLENIAMQRACEPPAAPFCTMPFDPGTGSDTIIVYAFHAPIGTCIPQLYTGAGGNANRFDDLQSCRAACPTTASTGGCPPNRQFRDDVCLGCGPLGACQDIASGCAKLCSTAEDCAGEIPGTTCSTEGVCAMYCL